jgi:hypothetical protein
MYAREVRSEVCQRSTQAVIATFRDMARAAPMDAVSAKLGGGGVAALEDWQVSRDRCPAYGDRQPGESAVELVSDVPENDRNRLRGVWPKVG